MLGTRQRLERRLDSSFKLKLAAKDASLVLDAAARAGPVARVARAVGNAFEPGVELGHGDDDMAAVSFAAGDQPDRSADSLMKPAGFPRSVVQEGR